jgi:hypothetical protein
LSYFEIYWDNGEGVGGMFSPEQLFVKKPNQIFRLGLHTISRISKKLTKAKTYCRPGVRSELSIFSACLTGAWARAAGRQQLAASKRGENQSSKLTFKVRILAFVQFSPQLGRPNNPFYPALRRILLPNPPHQDDAS